MEMLVCNVIGASFMAVYVVVFLALPSKEHRVKIYCQSAVAFLLVGVAVTVAILVKDPDTIFGVSAMTLNILKYASPLSVARRVIATQSVEYLPLPLTLASLACGICWGVHGLALEDVFIIVPNLAGILCSSLQIGLHLRYGGHFGSKKKNTQTLEELESDDATYQDVQCMVGALLQRLEAIPSEHQVWKDADRAGALSKCKTDLNDFAKSMKADEPAQVGEDPATSDEGFVLEV